MVSDLFTDRGQFFYKPEFMRIKVMSTNGPFLEEGK